MITHEETEYCKVTASYSAEENVVKDKRFNILKQFKKHPVPGFRPGKATDHAIRTTYKKEIEASLKQAMLNHANEDIIFETKIDPIGQPDVKSVNLVGNDFRCELNYLRKPTFELKQYKELEIPAPHMQETTEQMVESFLRTLQTKYADVRPYNDDEFVQDGDKCTLTVEMNDETKEGEVYDVGSNKYPDFDVNLLGMKPDETKEFGTYKVTLHMGLKSIPCALDDSLAQKCNVNTLKELMDSISIIATRQFNGEREELIAQQIRNILLATTEIKTPEWLTIMESKGLAAQNNVKWDEADEQTKEQFIKMGTDNINLSLIFDKITKEEPETVLSDNEALDMVKNYMVGRVQNIDEWIANAQKTGAIWGLITKVKSDFVMRWLVEHAKIIE